MKELIINSPTYGKYTFLISEKDWKKVTKINWSLSYFSETHVYAMARVNNKTIRLHQYILNTNGYKGLVVDHINGNTLDNRRENLQIVTSKQNVRKKRLSKKTKTGLYNVYHNQDVQNKHYRVKIGNIHIGRYNSIVDAKRAANLARRMHYGPNVPLNR